MMKRTVSFILIVSLMLCAGCAASSAALNGQDTPEAPAVNAEPVPETPEIKAEPEAPAITAEPAPEPEDNSPVAAPKPVVTAQSAAESLSTLGIMKGVLTEEGDVDYALDSRLDRETALVLIVRALGHDELSGVYPDSGFSDVDIWAVGAVNYAKASGITNGVSSTMLGAKFDITANEFSTMLLRALDYEGDFYFGEAYEFAMEMGVVSEIEGEKITRGDAAKAIYSLLGGTAKGSDETVIEELVMTGKITAEAAEAAGLSELVGEADGELLTGEAALEMNAGKIFTLSVYDKKGDLLREAEGVFIGEYYAVCAYEDIVGAKSLEINARGESYDVLSIGWYDEASGVVSLIMDTSAEPFEYFGYTGEAETETVYVLGASASSAAYGSGKVGAKMTAAKPVVDAKGHYLGLTTANSGIVKATFVVEWLYMPVADFAAAHWPDLLYPRGLDPTKPMIAITFDDGPSRVMTPKFLDLLEKYGVVATFFEIGNQLKANPQFMERMEELGCEVGNHTYSHLNLNAQTTDTVIYEITATDDIIESKLGHKATVMRAPYGNSNASVKAVTDHPLIHWTLDTRDWESRNADAIFDMIVKYSYDGCIILMHSIHEPTYNACLKAIPWLIQQGYQLVTISEMAELRGYELQNGVVYYSFPQQK